MRNFFTISELQYVRCILNPTWTTSEPLHHDFDRLIVGSNSVRLRQSQRGYLTPDFKDLILQQLQTSNKHMSQSIPTGHTPRENFFERANPRHPAIFLSNSLPRAKSDGRIPGGGAKFSQTRRNCSLGLQKIL